MGTAALTQIHTIRPRTLTPEGNSTTYTHVGITRSHDGYPSWHGRELARFLRAHVMSADGTDGPTLAAKLLLDLAKDADNNVEFGLHAWDDDSSDGWCYSYDIFLDKVKGEVRVDIREDLTDTEVKGLSIVEFVRLMDAMPKGAGHLKKYAPTFEAGRAAKPGAR